jgi:hypothetical protein
LARREGARAVGRESWEMGRGRGGVVGRVPVQ